MVRGKVQFLLEKYHRRYGPVFRVSWNKVIWVDPDVAGLIFGTYKFSKGSIYNGFRYFGDNLLTIKSREEHSKRRRLVAPGYSRNSILQLEPTILEKCVRPLLSNVESACGDKVDILHQFHYFSWDVIGEACFGHSLGMLKQSNHSAAVWVDSVLHFFLACYPFPFLTKFRFPSGEKLRQFSTDLLDSYYEKQQSLPPTILGHFTKAFDKESCAVLNKEVILAEAQLMLLAGTDTVSNTLGLFLHNLITHPRVYKKVIQEVRSVESHGLHDYATITAKMPYLQAALKESMCVLPPAPGTLFRHFLPGGTQISVPLYCLHRSAQFWENPEEFCPERWLEPLPKCPINPKCYIPFMVGPKACIGKELAMLEMLLALANLLARFDFFAHQNSLDLVALPVMRPQNSSIVTLVKRATNYNYPAL
ncbi:hypothetical protein L0F63_005770 [Massospora cicadina]|nr:hypothetical protein L0F63_005770 [Massospora cicadina]